MSPDGELVATGGGSNTAIHVWDLKTGATKHVLAGTGAPGWAAGFSEGRARGSRGATSGARTIPPGGYGTIQFSLTLPATGTNIGQPEPISAETAASDFCPRTRHERAY